MARIAAQAATIESVYWPTLKRTRHAGLPEWMSWRIEATLWAMSAGPRPPTRSMAIANDAESVSSSSSPRRGILIGSISPSTTPPVSTAKVKGSSRM